MIFYSFFIGEDGYSAEAYYKNFLGGVFGDFFFVYILGDGLGFDEGDYFFFYYCYLDEDYYIF